MKTGLKQCGCFVSYNMSSQQHDAHGHKWWRETETDNTRYRPLTWLKLLNSFSLSSSFSLRLQSLSPHTMAQATTFAQLLHLFSRTKRSFLLDVCVAAVMGSSVLCCCAEWAVAFQQAPPPNSMQLVNSSNLDESQRTHGKSGLLFVLMLRIGENFFFPG